MSTRSIYITLWLVWISFFLILELSALWSGNYRYSLSELVWSVEKFGKGWSFARYFVAVFLLWLFGHMVFRWWR